MSFPNASLLHARASAISSPSVWTHSFSMAHNMKLTSLHYLELNFPQCIALQRPAWLRNRIGFVLNVFLRFKTWKAQRMSLEGHPPDCARPCRVGRASRADRSLRAVFNGV